MENNQPLQNYRILDLSRIWAGPYCTKLMADMGAQVIKMESLRVYDSHRGPVTPAPGIAAYPDSEPGDEPWNRNGWFNCLHMSKYGISLELTEASGRKVFEELVSISDVVVENFRQGSLERLGYDYEKLKSIRPDIIYVSMPAFGNSGPWKGYVAYGIGQEQLCGMAHMTGYENDGPMKSGINHGDPITGSHAAGLVLAALRYRKKTGKGMFVDVSQQESAVSLIGGEVISYQISGSEPERIGNHSPYFSPHNIYPCSGDDRWVTIAVTNESEWKNLVNVIDDPQLHSTDTFSNNEQRLLNQDELDNIISNWTVEHEMYDIVHKLQEAGVPSGPVLRGPDLLEDPHFSERNTFNNVDHPQVGPKWYPGFAWKMSLTPGQVHWPAPTLGQHNHTVYSEFLGLTDSEITDLEQTGVIGTKPTGSRII